MDRVDVVSLLMMCFILIMIPFTVVYADFQGNALHAFKKALVDPQDILSSWDPQFNPCTWFHVTCNNNDVTKIDLGNSGLTGPLVPELGNLDRLQYLNLYMNKFYGSIPKEIGNLTNLLSLDLSRNILNGSIPTELGDMASLRFLLLNDNNLSGPVPEVLTKLPNLQTLNVADNPDVLLDPLTDHPMSRAEPQKKMNLGYKLDFGWIGLRFFFFTMLIILVVLG